MLSKKGYFFGKKFKFPLESMHKISFQSIPREYQSNIENIKGNPMKKLYDAFNFQLLSFLINSSINDNKKVHENDMISFLLNYFENFKFITFNLILDTDVNQSVLYDAVICVEQNCIIIEHINLAIFNNIITCLQKNHISILNAGENFDIIETKTDEYIFKKEIDTFCMNFKEEIRTNNFIKKTIPAIAGYLIRRYFYPAEYFKNRSFFDFMHIKNENHIKSEFFHYISSQNSDIKTYHEIKNKITDYKNIQNILEFQEKDFIILRDIYENKQAKFYLAIHIETLYIFMMKKFIDPNAKTKEMEHEIYFNKHYSHRCLMHFYGFLIDNGNINGFIYEYMSNGQLDFFISSNHEKINETFSMIAINRILQGIHYLHSHSLIHRDIKPSNILLDHDFIPYICDFGTIKKVIDNKINDSENTNDIGSILYTSPEQHIGKNVSYCNKDRRL